MEPRGSDMAELSRDDLALLAAYEARTGEGPAGVAPPPLDAEAEAELDALISLHDRIESLPMEPVAPGVRGLVMAAAAQQARQGRRREGGLPTVLRAMLRPAPLMAMAALAALAVAVSVRVQPEVDLSRGRPTSPAMVARAAEADEAAGEAKATEAAEAAETAMAGGRPGLPAAGAPPPRSSPAGEPPARPIPRPRRTIETRVADMAPPSREPPSSAMPGLDDPSRGLDDAPRSPAPSAAPPAKARSVRARSPRPVRKGRVFAKASPNVSAPTGLSAPAPLEAPPPVRSKRAATLGDRPGPFDKGGAAGGAKSPGRSAVAQGSPARAGGEARFSLPPPPRRTASSRRAPSRGQAASPPPLEQESPGAAPAGRAKGKASADSVTAAGSPPSDPEIAALKKKILALASSKKGAADDAKLLHLLQKLRKLARARGDGAAARWAKARLDARRAPPPRAKTAKTKPSASAGQGKTD